MARSGFAEGDPGSDIGSGVITRVHVGADAALKSSLHLHSKNVAYRVLNLMMANSSEPVRKAGSATCGLVQFVPFIVRVFPQIRPSGFPCVHVYI